jgi:RND family efflux transporter MFP subunit
LTNAPFKSKLLTSQLVISGSDMSLITSWRCGWRRPALLAVLASLAVLAGCSKPPPATEDVRPVRVMTVAPAATTIAAELSGEVRPRIESRVGFQVAGRITDRRVEVGQRVRAGQLLATLDAADYRLGAVAAQAQLTAAQVDRDQQRLDFKRFEELNRQGFISGAELERRRAQLDAAEARYASAAAQANISGNQAAYATLVAPDAGVVTAIDAEVGQVVAAGQSVVRIAQSTEKEVLVALPESRLDQLRRISDVRVTLWAGSAPLRGRVREIAPLADVATRTYPARITLLDAPADVALGMTATVRFEAPLPQAVITVPMQALLRDGESTYVWKLDAARTAVSRHAVQVATIAGNDLVIAQGVQPGDVIVTAGVHLLKEGQQVKVLADLVPAAPAMVPITKPQSPAPDAAPAKKG